MVQKAFLEALKKALPKNDSFIETVAQILDISYDAAHRRVSLKSKLSIEESVMLSNYFSVSMDQLTETLNSSYLSVSKTQAITNEAELCLYFKTSYQSLEPLIQLKNSELIYSAKDIPLFYHTSSDLLSRFKFFVWLKLLDTNFGNKAFENYAPSVDIIKTGTRLKNVYKHLNVTEIWDVTSINSTLKQIAFYNQAGKLKLENALKLCDALNQLIEALQTKLETSPSTYKMYYNELHLMNNHVLVSTHEKEILYVPFTMLSYYQTNHKKTCQEARIFLNKQMQNSKLLNTAGERERHYFFNKMHQKIEALSALLKATQVLDFE